MRICRHFHIFVFSHQAYYCWYLNCRQRHRNFCWNRRQKFEPFICVEWHEIQTPISFSVSNEIRLTCVYECFCCQKVLILTVFLNLQQFQNGFIWYVNRVSEGFRPSGTHFTIQVFTFWNWLKVKNTVKNKTFRQQTHSYTQVRLILFETEKQIWVWISCHSTQI